MRAWTPPGQLDSAGALLFCLLTAVSATRSRSPEHLCPLKGALPIVSPHSHGLLDFRGKHTMCRQAPGQNE